MDVARNPSMDRKIEELCIYNFAAGSFHTKQLCSRLFFDRSWILLAKTAKSRVVPPFGRLRVTYTVHLWLVKKRVVD